MRIPTRTTRSDAVVALHDLVRDAPDRAADLVGCEDSGRSRLGLGNKNPSATTEEGTQSTRVCSYGPTPLMCQRQFSFAASQDRLKGPCRISSALAEWYHERDELDKALRDYHRRRILSEPLSSGSVVGVPVAEYQRVASASEVPAGEMTIVEVDGEEIAIANVDGEFVAFQNSCTHRGGPLGEGMLLDDCASSARSTAASSTSAPARSSRNLRQSRSRPTPCRSTATTSASRLS